MYDAVAVTVFVLSWRVWYDTVVSMVPWSTPSGVLLKGRCTVCVLPGWMVACVWSKVALASVVASTVYVVVNWLLFVMVIGWVFWPAQ